jgi:hypothetical protein
LVPRTPTLVWQIDLIILAYADDLLTVYKAIAPLGDPSKYLYHIASVPQVGLNNKIGPVWIGNLVGGGSAGTLINPFSSDTKQL